MIVLLQIQSRCPFPLQCQTSLPTRHKCFCLMISTQREHYLVLLASGCLPCQGRSYKSHQINIIAFTSLNIDKHVKTMTSTRVGPKSPSCKRSISFDTLERAEKFQILPPINRDCLSLVQSLSDTGLVYVLQDVQISKLRVALRFCSEY